MKKLTDDFTKAFDRCIEALSLNEFSRRTGIGMYTLRKFATRQTNSIKMETWDKIYPVLKPYLNDEEANAEILERIGSPARRHHDLVELSSDQKILLDTFNALSSKDKIHYLELLESEVNGTTHDYELRSLSREEAHLLGVFEHVEPAKQQKYLLDIVELATLEIRRIRRNN